MVEADALGVGSKRRTPPFTAALDFFACAPPPPALSAARLALTTPLDTRETDSSLLPGPRSGPFQAGAPGLLGGDE